MRDSTLGSLVLTALAASAGMILLRRRVTQGDAGAAASLPSLHMAQFRDPPTTENGASAARAAAAYIPPAHSPADSSPLARIRDRHEHQLLGIAGVTGVGIGQSASGGDAIMVFTRDASVRDRVPRQVENVPVETIVTGSIDAY